VTSLCILHPYPLWLLCKGVKVNQLSSYKLAHYGSS